jgi:hypothetical protein
MARGNVAIADAQDCRVQIPHPSARDGERVGHPAKEAERVGHPAALLMVALLSPIGLGEIQYSRT